MNKTCNATGGKVYPVGTGIGLITRIACRAAREAARETLTQGIGVEIMPLVERNEQYKAADGIGLMARGLPVWRYSHRFRVDLLPFTVAAFPPRRDIDGVASMARKAVQSVLGLFAAVSKKLNAPNGVAFCDFDSDIAVAVTLGSSSVVLCEKDSDLRFAFRVSVSDTPLFSVVTGKQECELGSAYVDTEACAVFRPLPGAGKAGAV